MTELVETSEAGLPPIWYRLRTGVRYGHAFAAASGLVVGLAFTTFGISRWLYAFRTFGPLVVWRFASVWILLAVAILFASSIFWIWLAFGRISAVRPFAEGVEIRRGLRRRAIRWEDVHAIYISATQDQLLGLGIATRASVKLQLAKGKAIKLTSAIEALAELAKSIKQHAYPRMLRGYSHLLQHGKAAKFGSITLTNHGFNWRKRGIPWQFISEAALKDGRLRIIPKPNHKEAPISIAVRKIPNVDLCFQLIQHLHADASS